ncbi:MAG: pyridoxal phosphate-dependent aminotransferase [bacterium]
MGLTLAKRMKRLGTETAFGVVTKVKLLEAQGRSIHKLHIGQPDFLTPANVCVAGITAIGTGKHGYGQPIGELELREAAAQYLSRTRNITTSPDNIVVTPGAKLIIALAMNAVVNPGDEVIVPDPGYPIYASMANLLGARVVSLPLRNKNSFAPDLHELKSLITDRTTMLVLNSPHNPTGAVLDLKMLAGIAEIVRRYPKIWILSDEVYDQIIYGEAHHSIISQPDMQERTILMHGHSKTYAMTGWRLGYCLIPDMLKAAFEKLMINYASCTAVMIQAAGAEALTGPQEVVFERMVEFRTRRARVVELLRDIPGVTCHIPDGAFYVFPNIEGIGVPCETLEADLLTKADVAVLAGTAFGQGGKGHLRLSYANSMENLEAGIKAMGKHLATY